MPDNNAAVLTREFVPADLQGEEYLKPFLDKPWDKTTSAEFFKKHDGLEKLLGKRPAIPDAKTAKPEELDKFFEQFRPEKADDYEIPVEKDAKVDPGFIKAVRDGLHAGKINKVQATTLLKSLTEYGAQVRANAAKEQAKKDAEFDTLSKTMLGEASKPTMERVRKLIAEHAPSVAKASIAKLDDNNLLIMAAVIDAIHKKYAPEDDLNGKGGSGGSGAGGGTAAEKREEMRKLIGSKPYANWQDPAHESTNAKVKQLAQEIADLEK